MINISTQLSACGKDAWEGASGEFLGVTPCLPRQRLLLLGTSLARKKKKKKSD